MRRRVGVKSRGVRFCDGCVGYDGRDAVESCWGGWGGRGDSVVKLWRESEAAPAGAGVPFFGVDRLVGYT